jgi:glucokinase
MSDGSKYSIGFDLGGTKMMACLFDDKFKAVARRRRPSKGQEGADQGLERMMESIQAILDEAKVSQEQVAAIGVGCPGVVNLSNGVLRHAPNLGWTEVPIGQVIRTRFGAPTKILNDVDAGAYGEYKLGAGKGASTLVAVFPGTGVGAGCVIEGRLLTGKNASCMELGHTRVHLSHLGTERGEPPVMESICGRLGIASAAIAEAYRGNAPFLLKEVGTDLENVKSGALARAIDAGDLAIRRIMENSIHHLGVAVSNVVDLLGPDVVVLGGGLVERFSKLYLRGVSAAIQRYASAALAQEVEVRQAKLGDDAVAAGAAAFALAQTQEAALK